MNYKNILFDIKDRILFLTINRESKLNALNKETLSELHFAIIDACQNKHIGGVILTGAGTKAFVAGADITEFKNFDKDQGHDLAREGQTKVFDMIAGSNKPIIAAINGFALGGGLELAMACHIRIASEHAKLSLPEVSLGLIPGYGGTQRLTQLVGKGRALELILTADMITASDAYRWGLVNHVVNSDELLTRAQDMMQKIMSRSPIALSSAIRAVNASLVYEVNGFDVEIAEFASCFGTADFKEGVSAFLEKRKAIFSKM
jgi:enoyl-CoA hydratase